EGDTTHSITIENNDTATLTVTNIGESETNSNQTFDVNVQADAAVQGGFDVAFSLGLGTAESSDVSLVTSSPLNFSGDPNELHTITLTIVGDVIVEADETFTITLGDVTGTTPVQDAAIVTGAIAAGTIFNDDTANLLLDVNNGTQLEGDSGDVTFTFRATLDAPVEGGFDIDYSTNDGTATGGNASVADGDYTDNDATLTFAGSANEQHHIDVTVHTDAKVELDELFDVALASALDNLQTGIDSGDITIDTSPETATITNDDSATLSIDDVSLDEGDSGMTAFTFTVTLDSEVDAAVNVDFATATIANEAEDETGANSGTFGGDDFDSQAGSISFSADGGVNQTRTITIDVNGDVSLEFDELFDVHLSNISASGRELPVGTGSGITFADSQGRGTIVNDDRLTMFVNDVVVQEGDLGISPFVFNVTFDGTVTRDFSVDYATEDVDATAGDDYAAASGTRMFLAGETSATVIVDVNGDRKIEDTESFILRFSNISDVSVFFAGEGATLGGVATAINDDFEQQLITTSGTATDTGGSPNAITITDPDTGDTTTITPFASNFEGGSNVTTGDFNFDGRAEIIAAAKAGGGPHVQVYDSSGALFLEFMAYDIDFKGGVNVAVADFNRDGVADILTGPGPGGGPHVKVFDGTNPENLLFDQLVYTSTFLGGVHVAAGDVTGDGIPDIITGPGEGGGPNVKVFDGVNGAVVHDFFAYDPAFGGGVFVSAGDFNGDQYADIVMGAGPGGGPHVRVYSGQDLSILQDFFAYDSDFSGGVNVTAADINGDGIDDVLVGPSDGSTGVGRRAMDGTTGAAIPRITPKQLGSGPITTSSSAMTPNGNVSPYVINPLADVALSAGKPLNWAVPDNTFFDPNVNDTLALAAYVDSGDPLPAWLSFDANTNTFSGTPGTSDLNLSRIRLVADDGNLGTSSTFFGVNVSAAATP
ncbi:MAG: putative Ig domain-containing protein, partial [Planctomycetota bacterium]|nr:putative Ig domain-containing protein [Planctomycetota bacterium]